MTECPGCHRPLPNNIGCFEVFGEPGVVRCKETGLNHKADDTFDLSNIRSPHADRGLL